VGGRIVAEYDSLSKKVTQLESNSTVHTRSKTRRHESTIKEMATKTETGDRPQYKKSERNQQLKKWLLRWKPVIDHSTKRVKEINN
jgi:hypothetical protein